MQNKGIVKFIAVVLILVCCFYLSFSFVTRHYESKAAAMGEVLTDCFVTTGRGIGLSYNQKAFSFRIDHIFCSKDIQPYNCQIDDKMDASDHYPVICWLKIR